MIIEATGLEEGKAKELLLSEGSVRKATAYYYSNL
jgi:N-acetylmuramic acid 6-phosphate etherase